MAQDSPVAARYVPEGTVPLVAFEGDAYDCGREYAAWVLEHHGGYRRYLDMAWDSTALPPDVRVLFEERAPHILDLYRGLTEVAGPPASDATPPGSACTSFSASGSLTLDGRPVSGQTKDTGLASAEQYIVLRLRMAGAPTILVLCYPGEVLGYGLWSTGMSIFRNSLYVTGRGEGRLNMVQWGLLALAGTSVREAGRLAEEHGIADVGNCLISDAAGESVSVEFSNAGVRIVPADAGISVHTNHGVAAATQAVHSDDEDAHADSRYRRERLLELLCREKGRLTPHKALQMLADHSAYPMGICRHPAGGADYATTAAVIAEPTEGRLYVTRGNPCCNWPATYSI